MGEKMFKVTCSLLSYFGIFFSDFSSVNMLRLRDNLLTHASEKEKIARLTCIVSCLRYVAIQVNTSVTCVDIS